MAERASEVTELKRNLAQALRDKKQLQEVNQQCYRFFFFGCFFAGGNTWLKTTQIGIFTSTF